MNKDEALKIIDELLETISWLGGDSYEMDFISETVNKASKFLEDNRPKVKVPLFKTDYSNLGIYTSKDNTGRIVRAVNRSNASRILGLGKKHLKCIKVPKF